MGDVIDKAAGEPSIGSHLGAGSCAMEVGTFVEAASLSYDPDIVRIYTTGFGVDADGGGATYDRWTSAMPALPADGEGVWWFGAADGSQWQIAANIDHYAAMFGALGGPGIDALPILSAAFAAPMVPGIHLGALTHHFSPELVVPSGKFLKGVSRALSWMKVIPVVGMPDPSAPRFGILHQNDEGGLSQDYSLDCSRSGEADTVEHGWPHGVVVFACNGGTCRGTRIRRVDVHNCWGYAHYTTTGITGDGLLCEDIVREDCRAINFNVGFEETGTIKDCWNRDCYADASAQDGGTLLKCEALYHQYGNILNFTSYNAVGRGKAQSGISVFTVERSDVGEVKYVNPDIDATADYGVFVAGRLKVPPSGTETNVVRDFQLIDGRIRVTGSGVWSENATVTVYNTKITALDGTGITVNDGASLRLHAPDIESNRDPTGSTTAVGIATSGGTVNWYGSGRLAAFGPPGMAIPGPISMMNIYGAPQLVPGSGKVAVVATDQYFRIPAANWTTITEDSQYFAVLDLSGLAGGGLRDFTKTMISATLEQPWPGSTLTPTTTIVYIDSATVRIHIATTVALTNWVLRARVTEFAI